MRAKLLALIVSIAALLGTLSASDAAPSADAELAAFAQAWNRIAAYSSTVTLFEKNGANVQNIVFDYQFRKPSSFSVRIIKGNIAGATLVWHGGTTVQATRGKGLFGALFKRKLSLYDPLVTTIRGSSLDELSYGAILAHMEDTHGTLSEISGGLIDGVPIESVSLTPQNPSADAGFTHEIIDISTTTHLPIRIQGYDGSTLVRMIDFSNIKSFTDSDVR